MELNPKYFPDEHRPLHVIRDAITKAKKKAIEPEEPSTKEQRAEYYENALKLAKLERELAEANYAEHSTSMMLMGRFADEYLGEVGKRIELHQARLSARQKVLQLEAQLDNMAND